MVLSCVSVCVCTLHVCMYMYVCATVTTLASISFVSTFQARYMYIQLLFRLFLINNSWLFDNTFHSRVSMARKS